MWSVSHPGKTGTPNFDLSKDPEASVANSTSFTPAQLAHERVVVKVFTHYAIPLEITDPIRASFKAKLWRMGKRYSNQGGKQREQQLLNWKEGKDSVWNFEVSEVEVNRQLLKRKRCVEAQIEEEVEKRRKLESEVKTLQCTTKKQSKMIARLSTGHKTNSRGPSSKSWCQYTRQQQYNKRKSLASSVQGALTFCEEEGFKPCSVEIENVDTGKHEVIDMASGVCSPVAAPVCSAESDSVHSVLYIKDKFSVSNEAFHELSMVSNLPNSSKINSLTRKLNDDFSISCTPNGVVGVQQSLRERIMVRLNQLIDKASEQEDVPSTLRVKLTGDGTQIARGLSVVNINFTLLEEGQSRACSAFGNHSIAILRVSENYEELKAGLEDIIKEAEDLEVVTMRGKVYSIQFFLGGDLKFLAAVCGIEAANSEHACIWCKCPKQQRSNMALSWSIQDQSKGARTIEEIQEKCKLGKTSKSRFNCCHPPMFPFIPIERVIIDSLHLFLRIADVLINLLIRDLRILDGVDKATSLDQAKTTNMNAYQSFLNETCKIRFQWYLEKEAKKLKWRDLTGPEKKRLFDKIDIPTLFPSLRQSQKIQKLWVDFFGLIRSLSKSKCDADEFQKLSKEWVLLLTSVYQSKDVTPYIHAFAQHVHEFLRLYGNIVIFNQQGLEKLNDLTTKHFQRATNHQGYQALKQVLEKRNRIELLEDGGYQRPKQVQTCTICRQPGHNKRSCSSHI